jgi:hypothetical protein
MVTVGAEKTLTWIHLKKKFSLMKKKKIQEIYFKWSQWVWRVQSQQDRHLTKISL